MSTKEIREKLYSLALATPAVDAHTHVQDDLTDFTREVAAGNLAGTQAAVNRPPDNVVTEGIHRGLRDSRYSEYAEWLRYMYGLYSGVPKNIDPLEPKHLDLVADAIAAQRHDPAFAEQILKAHHIRAYVTSIENRDKVPLVPPVRPKDVDLGYSTHAEAWNMFDFNSFFWPERATDFGLFTHGH